MAIDRWNHKACIRKHSDHEIFDRSSRSVHKYEESQRDGGDRLTERTTSAVAIGDELAEAWRLQEEWRLVG
jgi:hypothetical protein